MGQHDTMMAVLDMQCITGLLTGRGPWILQSMVGTRYIRIMKVYTYTYIYKYTKKQIYKYTACMLCEVKDLQ